MVHHVRANVVVDLVEHPVVTIDRGQPAAHVAPFLASIPRHLLLVSVMVEVRYCVEPHHVDDVGHEVELEDPQKAELGDGDSEEGYHQGPTDGGHSDFFPLTGVEEVAVGIEVRAHPAGGARPEVDGVGDEGGGELETSQAAPVVEGFVEGGCHGIPRLVILHMAVVGVVCAVGDSPAVVGDEDGRVEDMADDVVEPLGRGEAAVAAVVAEHEDRPEHGTLGDPVDGVQQPRVCSRGDGGEKRHHYDVAEDVTEGS